MGSTELRVAKLPKLAFAIFLTIVFTSFSLLAAEIDPQPLQPAASSTNRNARIVNGADTVSAPSVVALTLFNGTFCTGTLIGCSTVLTAAHCVCDSTGVNCQPDGIDLLDAELIEVYAQHAGFFDVLSVSVPSNYEFGLTSDVAVLKLATYTNGIAPSSINTIHKPAVGAPGRITGFGLTQSGLNDTGIKRTGLVQVAECNSVPDNTHVCWFFEEPIGPPGDDSNTCSGDSGGPLFVDFGNGPLIAGVTSGGFNNLCLPPDESFDADIFDNRDFILNIAGDDVANATCGDLGQAGSVHAPITFGAGTLDGENQNDTFFTEVPAEVIKLRVALNGEDGINNDFDLYVKFGDAPTTSNYDCRGIRGGTYEACEFDSPQPGIWYFMAQNFAGSGDYQLVVTEFMRSTAIFSDGFEGQGTAAASTER